MKVVSYSLGGSYKVFQKFKNDLFIFTLGKSFHRGGHQVELLLKIIEANLS